MRVCVHARARVSLYECSCVCVCVYMCLCMCLRECACICAYTCVCVCVQMCVCMWHRVDGTPASDVGLHFQSKEHNAEDLASRSRIGPRGAHWSWILAVPNLLPRVESGLQIQRHALMNVLEGAGFHECFNEGRLSHVSNNSSTRVIR